MCCLGGGATGDDWRRENRGIILMFSITILFLLTNYGLCCVGGNSSGDGGSRGRGSDSSTREHQGIIAYLFIVASHILTYACVCWIGGSSLISREGSNRDHNRRRRDDGRQTKGAEEGETPMIPQLKPNSSLLPIAPDIVETAWEFSADSGKPIVTVGLTPPTTRTRPLHLIKSKNQGFWMVKDSADWRAGRHAQLVWTYDNSCQVTGMSLVTPGVSPVQKRLLWKQFVSTVNYRFVIQAMHRLENLRSSTPRTKGFLKRFKSTHRNEGPAGWGVSLLQMNLQGEGPLASDEGNYSIITNSNFTDWCEEAPVSPDSAMEGENEFVPPPLMLELPQVSSIPSNPHPSKEEEELQRNHSEMKSRLDLEIAAPGIADKFRLAKIDTLKRKLHELQVQWDKVIFIYSQFLQMRDVKASEATSSSAGPGLARRGTEIRPF